MPRISAHRSRRVPPLKDSDYDHEIHLVDNAADDDSDVGTDAAPAALAAAQVPAAPAKAAASAGQRASNAATLAPISTSSSAALITTPSHAAAAAAAATTTNEATSMTKVATAASGRSEELRPSRKKDRADSDTPLKKTPRAQLLPVASAQSQSQSQSRPSLQSVRSAPESAIDVLYENERGLFLCGIPLFSRRALGNLDPSPWTNAAQGPSPTDIHTAQVPDPSWTWAWPEWRINHDATAATDQDGWEYSFMFARCFSWHGRSWYSSFVRRRVWLRKRVKRSAAAAARATSLAGDDAAPPTDPHLLNPDYFTVLPASSARRSSSRASSRRLSQAASCASADGDDDDDDDGSFHMPDTIDDVDLLMRFLRSARIDREKIDAVDNFLQHGGDNLVRLQDVMHEIMTLFVFQVSRRALLTRLTHAYDAAIAAERTAADDRGTAADDKSKEKTEDSTTSLGRRVGYLAAAVHHANEEVRRLEYWSDVKAMGKSGAQPASPRDGDACSVPAQQPSNPPPATLS